MRQEQVGVGVPVALSGVGDRTCLCGCVRPGWVPSLGKEGLVGNAGVQRGGQVMYEEGGCTEYTSAELYCVLYVFDYIMY